MAIGGAEDKLGATRILRRFVAEAGGPDARIVVCATASALGPEIVELYERLFTRLDVRASCAVHGREIDNPYLGCPDCAAELLGGHDATG